MHRWIHRLTIALPVALLFSGCASVVPPVDRQATVEKDSAYVAGIFTNKAGGPSFAMMLTNETTGAEYGMPLGVGNLADPFEDSVVAIRVPPGRYRVSRWLQYASLTKERSGREVTMTGPLSQPVDLTDGAVRFLGRFTLLTSQSYSGNVITINRSITPARITTAEAAAVFHEAYPALKETEFKCTLCLD